MARKIRTGLVAVLSIGVLTGGVPLMPPAPAQAQNFFEQLFGGSARYDRRNERRRYDSRRGFYRGGDPTDYRGRDSGPRIIHPEDTGLKIESPKYHTYRPDTLQTVSLSALAKGPSLVEQRAQAKAAARLAESGDTALAGTGDAHLPDNAGTAGTRAAALTSSQESYDLARSHLDTMELRVLPEVGKALIAHYEDNPDFIWVSEGRPNARARAAMAVLERAEEIGLSADDYRVDMPDTRTAFNAVGATGSTGTETSAAAATGAGLDAQESALMRFEMALSAKVATYVLDATRGRVDPNRISGYHDLPRHKVDLTAALAEADETRDIARYLESRGPQHEQFRALKDELARLQALEDDVEPVRIAGGTFVRPGQSDGEMANIVAAIRQRGSDDLMAAHAETLAGYQGGERYTPELAALVRDFQRENDLKDDGVVGPNTIAAMTQMSNADRIEKVRLAMERLRWLPHELGETRVFVNQPAYRATFQRNGREEISMKVVVGTRANQTNFFYDTLDTVEYNPYWGVPLSIIVNEYLPKLSQNPYYFDDAGYEVTTPQGQRVSSAQVDWYAVATKEASINVRQLPGPQNALGELKILFPNRHNIYMHDTPQKHLFSRGMRAYSHGCIRLEDPRAMAAAVLGKERGYVSSQVGRGDNHSDSVPGDIPVYIAYFTAWVDSDGEISFYDDVYGRDEHLARAIEATRAARGVSG